MKYTIGLDYGTDSVRALVVDQQGREVATHVHYYTRWKQGFYCRPSESQFRQHPLDYIEGLEQAILGALAQVSSEVRSEIVGISVDTTGSTPVAVDRAGTPLALLPEFAENPHAMFILWKDHTANQEAEEINTLARRWAVDYTQYVGGIYSSEWFWAKILRTLRVDPHVREAAFSWVEHCDWISALLTGNTDPLTLKRSRCAAGHKAMWHESYGGLPPEDFWVALDPVLAGLRERLFTDTYTSDQAMGRISPEWANRLGLLQTVIIGVGAFDAHMGGVGAEIKPYSLVRVMGTSTCDMLIAPSEEVQGKLIRGICGQVEGSIVPGMLGMEAGQSAFGDVYAWFQELVLGPVLELLDSEDEKQRLRDQFIPHISQKAAEIPVTESDPIALDWFNGRRTPDANHLLKGAISGLNLGSHAAVVFKSLVEATAFGSKAIVDRFELEGVPIQEIIAIGGVAKKSAFVMQTLANVLNRPIQVVTSDQACALGAAMNAAVAAGLFVSIQSAQQEMGSGFDAYYTPDATKVAVYQKLYQKYQLLGAFTERLLTV